MSVIAYREALLNLDSLAEGIEVKKDEKGNYHCIDTTTGRLHSYYDLPAVVRDDGMCMWMNQGVLSRECGPAVIYPDGTTVFFKDGSIHRPGNLPAVEYPPKYGEQTGTRKYYDSGCLHRSDGPAIERETGESFWYLWGRKIEELKGHFAFDGQHLLQGKAKEDKEETQETVN